MSIDTDLTAIVTPTANVISQWHYTCVIYLVPMRVIVQVSPLIFRYGNKTQTLVTNSSQLPPIHRMTTWIRITIEFWIDHLIFDFAFTLSSILIMCKARNLHSRISQI